MEHKPVLQMGSDRMLLRYAYHKTFSVVFSDKCEWQNGFNPDEKGDLVWYTDESKTNKALVLGLAEGLNKGAQLQFWVPHHSELG